MTVKLPIPLIIAATLFSASAKDKDKGMFDPSVVDDANREWCYGGRTTTVLGSPWQPDVAQFTFDGSIFVNTNAELHFYIGAERKPILARQRHWMNGWLPIINYEWQEGDLVYKLEAFGSELEKIGPNNVVHYARLSVRNAGKTPQLAVIGAGLRGTGMDYRRGSQKNPITAKQNVSIDNNIVSVDGVLSAIYRGDDIKFESVVDKPYTAPFNGGEASLDVDTSYALANRSATLAPGESIDITAALPRLRPSDSNERELIVKSDYENERQRVISYWENFFKRGTFTVPEPRVEASHRASLVHLALATRSNNGIDGRRQGSGLPYSRLFLNDYIDMMMAWMRSGHQDMHQYSVQWLKDKQVKETGMFIDVHNRGNDDLITSHTHAMFSLAYPPVFTNDVEAGKDVFPYVKKAVDLLIRDHKSGKYHGLLRPTLPYDAPMVCGLASCHNMLGVAGLRASIRLARLVGEDELAAEWLEVEETYTKAVIEALNESFEKEGYVRSHLYTDHQITDDFLVKDRRYASAPSKAEFLNQDWENVYMGYPSELLATDNPIFLKSLDFIRNRKYREGVSSYRNGMHIHQYNTVNMAHQFLVTGQQEKALVDLYHILLHNGPTHEGFENLVEPWTNRTPAANCPPPHAWAAAKIGLFLRNMMVLEYGGRLGLDEGERRLHLFNLIAPTWAVPGEKLTLNDIPTEFGSISGEYKFLQDGAEISIDKTFWKQPKNIVLRVPYFVELTGVSSDAGEPKRIGDELYFKPEVTSVKLQWKAKAGAHDGTVQEILTRYRSEYPEPIPNDQYATYERPVASLTADEQNWPATPLSFKMVCETFNYEYGRRFKEHAAAGKKIATVTAPKVIKAIDKNNLIVDAPGLTVKAQAVSSSNQEQAHYATDGNRSSQRFAWNAEQAGDWWQVTLPVDTVLTEVTIVANSHLKRPSAKYVIEYSPEGGMWYPIVDFSKKADTNVGAGSTHKFAPVTANYLRVRTVEVNTKAPFKLLEVTIPKK